jgi:hypothetical protein
MHDLLHDLMPPKEQRVRTGFGRGVLAVPLRWGVMAVVLIASCSTSVSGTNATVGREEFPRESGEGFRGPRSARGW